MERSMILYLSGPITGVDNYQEIFRAAKGQLVTKGYKVIHQSRRDDRGATRGRQL